jgi:ubiquitin-conjugating enzyme E2 O
VRVLERLTVSTLTINDRNLYEEGKVCLSILGTWAGERSESWSAARSSLLQAFVSIQGLVLVKDPYFCEPSFEKMRGTEEGMLNRFDRSLRS